ncbi:MAG TPA: ABC transporter substrate-binding protein [Gemmatimonadota bacterium]|nr:ABC transporter substrate-binding protein [Gemmatimonadota bacterium]
MRSPGLSTLLGSLLVVAVTGCGGSAPEVASDGLVRIDMAAQAFLSNGPLYIGLEEGYFADEGIDLHLHPSSESGSTTLPALDRGNVAVSTMTNLIAIVNAIDQGGRVRVVLGTSYAAPDRCSPSGLVARKGLFPEGKQVTPEDLRGKRIDLNPLSSEGYFLDTFLARGGLSLDDIEPVSLPVGARVEAMNRGAIDMTGISEPWVTRLVDAGHRLVLTRSEIIPGTQSGFMVFGSRLLEDDRELGRRFVAAFVRASRQFNEGPTPRNIEILSRDTGIDVETLKRACWATMRNDGGIQTEQVLAFQRWALAKGHIERVVDIDELWDPWFTEPFRNESADAGGR